MPKFPNFIHKIPTTKTTKESNQNRDGPEEKRDGPEEKKRGTVLEKKKDRPL